MQRSRKDEKPPERGPSGGAIATKIRACADRHADRALSLRRRRTRRRQSDDGTAARRTSLRKGAGGKYKARSSRPTASRTSSSRRRTADGNRHADSRAATTVADYWNVIDPFLETGDESGLTRLPESIADAQGNRLPLLIDPDELERLGAAGVLRLSRCMRG